MVVAAVASLIGMLVDPRIIITGATAWLKPFKFAVSTAIYSLTRAWIYGQSARMGAASRHDDHHVGALTGPLMTRPTASQLADARA
jgi:hypothetical protein